MYSGLVWYVHKLAVCSVSCTVRCVQCDAVQPYISAHVRAYGMHDPSGSVSKVGGFCVDGG